VDFFFGFARLVRLCLVAMHDLELNLAVKAQRLVGFGVQAEVFGPLRELV
jgi:hypothetical protein